MARDGDAGCVLDGQPAVVPRGKGDEELGGDVGVTSEGLFRRFCHYAAAAAAAADTAARRRNGQRRNLLRCGGCSCTLDVANRASLASGRRVVMLKIAESNVNVKEGRGGKVVRVFGRPQSRRCDDVNLSVVSDMVAAGDGVVCALSVAMFTGVKVLSVSDGMADIKWAMAYVAALITCLLTAVVDA